MHLKTHVNVTLFQIHIYY